MNIKDLIVINYQDENGDHKSVAEFMDGTGQKITRNINENHNVEYKPLIDLTKRKKNGDK